MSGGPSDRMKDFLMPGTLIGEKLFGGPDQGVTPPPVQQSADLPLISSQAEEGKKRSVFRRSGRRKTLLTRKNQMGAGDISKSALLGG